MVILITGATHTGKTLLAKKLAEKYKFPCASMDHLKMGLIRSGVCPLSPEDDDKLTGYLWPVVREMIKTVVENRQDLIIEGCYVPGWWQRDFSEKYLRHIRFICLAMTDRYIDSHFEKIKAHAMDIEARLDDSHITPEYLKEENGRYMDRFDGSGLVAIDESYKSDVEKLFHFKFLRSLPPAGEVFRKDRIAEKYAPFWEWLGKQPGRYVILPYKKIADIAGFAGESGEDIKEICKTEARRHGWEPYIFTKYKDEIRFTRLHKGDVYFVHGEGGSPDDGKGYAPLFPGWTTILEMYKEGSPKEAAESMGPSAAEPEKYVPVILIAESFGAYYAMHSGMEGFADMAFFISPVLDMEKYIADRLRQNGLTEEYLKECGGLELEDGEVLWWDHLQYAREHPIKWSVPTEIVCGSEDSYTSAETYAAFAEKHNARLHVLKGAGHRFSAKKEREFVNSVITEGLEAFEKGDGRFSGDGE